MAEMFQLKPREAHSLRVSWSKWLMSAALAACTLTMGSSEIEPKKLVSASQCGEETRSQDIKIQSCTVKSGTVVSENIFRRPLTVKKVEKDQVEFSISTGTYFLKFDKGELPLTLGYTFALASAMKGNEPGTAVLTLKLDTSAPFIYF